MKKGVKSIVFYLEKEDERLSLYDSQEKEVLSGNITISAYEDAGDILGTKYNYFGGDFDIPISRLPQNIKEELVNIYKRINELIQ